MQMVGGFTPADQIISFNGLVWASVIHRMLVSYHAYEVVVLVGLLSLVVKGLPSRAFTAAWVYLILATATFLLFGTSLQSIAQVSAPATVASGASVTRGTERDWTQPPGILTEVGLPRGFFLVNNAMDSFARMILATTAGDFVRNPFLVHAALNRLAAEHFQADPALQQRLAEFIDDCYSHALLEWSREHPTPTTEDKLGVDTPAGAGIVPYYAKINRTTTSGIACDAAWAGGPPGGGLRDGLVVYVQRFVSPAANAMRSVLGSLGFPTSDDALLQSTLRTWREYNTAAIADAAPENSGGKFNPLSILMSVTNFALTGVSKITNRLIISQMSEYIRLAAYPVYGFTLMALYALFPVVLALSLLPGQLGRLAQYFLIVFSVKLWPVLWALISHAHTAALPHFTGGTGLISPTAETIIKDPGGWSYPGMIQMVAAMMYVGVPMTTSLILGVNARHLGSTIGQWHTTALPSLGSMISGARSIQGR